MPLGIPRDDSGSGLREVALEKQGAGLEPVALVEAQRGDVGGHHTERYLGAPVLPGPTDHIVE
jgi:hypothetical protein